MRISVRDPRLLAPSGAPVTWAACSTKREKVPGTPFRRQLLELLKNGW